MERLVRPVARQLLRTRPRYPFSVPPPPAIKRLYTMGHSRPDVSLDLQYLEDTCVD